jgi:hypothetical protein
MATTLEAAFIKKSSDKSIGTNNDIVSINEHASFYHVPWH